MQYMQLQIKKNQQTQLQIDCECEETRVYPAQCEETRVYPAPMLFRQLQFEFSCTSKIKIYGYDQK